MEGEIKSAEARVELSRKKFERADELQKKNFVSASARDEAEAELPPRAPSSCAPRRRTGSSPSSR